MVADTTLTCHSQIFNVLNLIFNLKTHQTYYEATAFKIDLLQYALLFKYK